MIEGQRTAMAIVETGNNLVEWKDIEELVAAGGTPASIAGDLNNDYRHLTGTTYSEVYRLLFNIAEAMGRVSQNADWTGVWIDRINEYETQGTAKQIAFNVWKKIRAQSNNSPEYIPIGDADFPYAPQSTSVNDRWQKGGLGFEEFDALLQEIVDVPDPAYTGDLKTAQEVHDLWLLLTGGRKFGIVTDADVQAVIDQRNADESRYSSLQVTNEARTRGQVAFDAADASYRAGDADTAVRAAYKAAWDNWPEPPLPYSVP